MNRIEIFSKVMNAPILISNGNYGNIIVSSSLTEIQCWSDSGWNNIDGWVDSGWNNTDGWLDGGWNNTDGWIDGGWNNW